MGGRLRHFETAWRSLTDNSWVIRTVRGYKLELVDSPQDAPPTTFQEEQPDLWDQVLELLHKGAVELAPVKSGFFSPMFVIPKKDGTSNHKSQETEFPHTDSTLQDGEYLFSKIS